MKKYKVLVSVIGNTKFAIELKHIKEVFILSQVTRIPVAPPFMNWVDNWQGEIIPIVDLAPFVSEKIKALVTNKLAMAVQYGHETTAYALVIDKVIEIKEVNSLSLARDNLPYFTKDKIIWNQDRLLLVDPSRINKMIKAYISDLFNK
ncbi:MAG: chemotaxis protein CheW [Myxococcota bacterium]